MDSNECALVRLNSFVCRMCSLDRRECDEWMRMGPRLGTIKRLAKLLIPDDFVELIVVDDDDEPMPSASKSKRNCHLDFYESTLVMFVPVAREFKSLKFPSAPLRPIKPICVFSARNRMCHMCRALSFPHFGQHKNRNRFSRNLCAFKLSQRNKIE